MKSEDQTNLYRLKMNAFKSKIDVKVPGAIKRHARHKCIRGKIPQYQCISNGPVAFLVFFFPVENTLWKHCAAKKLCLCGISCLRVTFSITEEVFPSATEKIQEYIGFSQWGCFNAKLHTQTHTLFYYTTTHVLCSSEVCAHH